MPSWNRSQGLILLFFFATAVARFVEKVVVVGVLNVEHKPAKYYSSLIKKLKWLFCHVTSKVGSCSLYNQSHYIMKNFSRDISFKQTSKY